MKALSVSKTRVLSSSCLRVRSRTALPVLLVLVSLLLAAGVSADTPPVGCIKGRVTDAATGSPVAGRVDLSGPSLNAVEVTGDYRICNVWAGDYWVIASSPGYLSRTHNGDDTCGHDCTGRIINRQLLTVGVGDEKVVDFTLSRGAGVRGRITNHAGEPLAAEVSGYRLTDTGTISLPAVSTDSTGHYEFPQELWGGSGYKLVVRSDRYLPAMTGLPSCTFCNPWDDGETIELTRGASRTVDFQLEDRFGIVTGRVIDRSSRQPIAGAEVVSPGMPAASTTTDAGGRYALEVERKPFRIYASAYDYAQQIHPCRYRCDLFEVPEMSLGADSTAVVDFELSTLDLWHVTPSWSRPEGGDIATLVGRGLARVVELRMDGKPIPLRTARENFVEFRLPSHPEGTVTLTVVDSAGATYDLVDGLTYWKGAMPRRIRDLEPTLSLVGNESPRDLVTLKDALYFNAGGGSIWRSDGTAEGSWSVEGATAESLVAFKDQIYFVWDYHLHRSDGTEWGSELVRTAEGYPLKSPAYLHVAAGRLYFRALDHQDQSWIWIVDESGELRKLQRVFDGESLMHIGVLGTRLLFGADFSQGHTIWIGDGSPEGTKPLVKGGHPSEFTEVGGKSYFVVTTIYGRNLMVTDGTPAGTKFVIKLEPGYAASSYLTAFRGRLYFQTSHSKGTGVWSTDGTEAGTRFEFPGRGRMLVLGSYLYFLTDTQLRRTNGSEVSSFREVDYGELLSVAGNRIWYEEHNPNRPCETSSPGCTALWVSNGTVSGTIRMEGLVRYGGAAPVDLKNGACFPAIGPSTGAALWCVDAGSTQPRFVMTFAEGKWFRSSDPQLFPMPSGRLYLSATTSETGRELWASDLTEPGTILLKDINPGARDGANGPVLEIGGGRAIFIGSNEEGDAELWVTEGSPETTRPLMEQRPGPVHGVIQLLFTIGGRAYFLEQPQWDEPSALWSTDGTVAGTRRALTPAPQSPLVWGSSVVFPGNSQHDECVICQWNPETDEVRELWRPQEVRAYDPRVERLEESGGSLFVHLNGVGWGSVYLLDEDEHSIPISDTRVDQIVSAGASHLLLSQSLIPPHDRLWIRRHDGSPITLDETIIAEEGAGVAVIAGERVFIFVSRNNGSSRDLWVVDDAGLRHVASLAGWAGYAAGTPDGIIFFSYAHHGDREIWQSDGTAEGTRRAWDVNPAGSSNPTQLRVIGRHLVFVAGSPEDDLEPWVVRYKPDERQRGVRRRGGK